MPGSGLRLQEPQKEVMARKQRGAAPPVRAAARLEHTACLSVIRAADAVTRNLERLFRRHGLTFTQYNVLCILREAAEKGATHRQIAEGLIHTDPDVTGILDRLEKRRWVRRWRSETDRRYVTTLITPEGMKLLAGLEEPAARLRERQFSGLSLRELEQLVALLEKVEKGCCKS